MFKNLALQKAQYLFPEADQFLLERVAESIARRRARFLYLERHQAKLRAMEEPVAPIRKELTIKIQPEVVKEETTSKPITPIHPPLSILSKAVPSLSKQTDFSRTLATKMEPVPQERAESVSSTIMKTGEIPQVPPIDADTMSFFCPYCCLTCPATEAQSQDAWHKHLMQDLDPYFCITSKCVEPFQIGGTFMAWLSHIERYHTARSWECWHCRGTTDNEFTSEASLEEHLKMKHSDRVPDSLVPTALKHSVHYRQLALLACPFCGGYPDDVETKYPNRESREAVTALSKHVQTHLISISFLLLPIQVNLASNQNDVESDVNNGDRSDQDTVNFSAIDDILLHKDLQCNREGCDCMEPSSIPSGDFSASQLLQQAQPEEVINVDDPAHIAGYEDTEWEFWYPLALGGYPTRTVAEFPRMEDDQILQRYSQQQLQEAQNETLERIHYAEKTKHSLNQYLVIEPADEEGFRKHIISLNPSLELELPYLLDRLVRQQQIRYANLFKAYFQYFTAHDSNSKENSAILLAGFARRNTLENAIPLPVPVQSETHIQCHTCLQQIKVESLDKWNRHILSDVSPYSCTWQDCQDSKMFKQAADWVRHENENHRRIPRYKCDFPSCPYKTVIRRALVQHLIETHNLDEKLPEGDDLNMENAWVHANACEMQPSDEPRGEVCPFCMESFATWKAREIHVKRHMEQLVLPLFPLVALRVMQIKGFNIEQDQLNKADEAVLEENSSFQLEHNAPISYVDASAAERNEQSGTEQRRTLLTIGDSDTVWEFYLQQFTLCQQTACKLIATAWVNTLAPWHDMAFSRTGLGESAPEAPEWWPKPWGATRDDTVRYQNTDHLYKRELVHLLAHILRLVAEPNEKQFRTFRRQNLNVAKLKGVTDEALRDYYTENEVNASKRAYLDELFRVAALEERLKHGEDGMFYLESGRRTHANGNSPSVHDTMVWKKSINIETIPTDTQCEQSNLVSGKKGWRRLPETSFNICPTCYAQNFAAVYRRSELICDNSEDLTDNPVWCDYGSCPWYSAALHLSEDSMSLGMDLIHKMAYILGSDSTMDCPGDLQFATRWVSAAYPATSEPLRGFTICERCKELVELVLPPLRGLFYQQYEHTMGQCALEYSSGGSGFSLTLDILAEVAAKGQRKLPMFPELALELSSRNPCRRDLLLTQTFWFVMKEIPEFTVCRQCYFDHVKPQKRQALPLANKFSDKPELRGLASCQLYSTATRSIFKFACENNDLEYLKDHIERREE